MVFKVNHKELKSLIHQYYKNKIALVIYGAFGIGKSAVVRENAEEIAKQKKKVLVDWNRISKAEKLEVYNNPKGKFVFIDIRLSEYDGSDIKGLPQFDDGEESIDFKSPLWALLMEKEESDGILLFDEISLATPLVISSCYKILHDRIINDGKIADDWFILGATNRAEDGGHTHELASPVRDRCGEVELVPSDVQNWTDWASANGVDSRIITFLNFKQTALHNVDNESGNKFSTARGWERVSRLIQGLKGKDFELAVCSGVGEGNAREFIAFDKMNNKVNIDDIIKNPNEIKKISDISIKYIILSSVSDLYRLKKIDFKKLIEICRAYDEQKDVEFVALLWRLSTNGNKDFAKDFMSASGDEEKFLNKYEKYFK